MTAKMRKSGPAPMSDEERAKRMQRVWEKHLRGETITLDEFMARDGFEWCECGYPRDVDGACRKCGAPGSRAR